MNGPTFIAGGIIFLFIFFNTNISHGQNYNSKLIFDPIPTSATAGEYITFSGRLLTEEGYIIQNAIINIKDDVDFGFDNILQSGITNNNGEFYVQWKVVPRYEGGLYDIYAVFEGNNQESNSRSVTYSLNVIYNYGEDSSQNNNIQYITLLSLDPFLTPTTYVKDEIVFKGRLTSNANPLSNELINIMEDDPLLPDSILASGRTDSNGFYEIIWSVRADNFETEFDIYASFDGNGQYKYARTDNQLINVLQYGGSISLDPLPTEAKIGDIVEFSGTLYLENENPVGSLVYIKDQDPFSLDDLLATAYVNSNGQFSTDWIARQVDANFEADIYATYEGSKTSYRLTTCDENPTKVIGNLCINTYKLLIFQPEVEVPIIGKEKYIELYYSLDLDRYPNVAIVLSPDSYDVVKKYSSSVQEGIMMWKSALESRYGGEWNIDFQVIPPGGDFDAKPEIIVNLISEYEDEECIDAWGYAKLKKVPSLPIQTVVCIKKNIANQNSEVMATAAHEFIHAMGLGHSFNIPGDLMCSGENDQETCPGTFNTSKKPTKINLEATISLYDIDGFKNPNKNVLYGTKYPVK